MHTYLFSLQLSGLLQAGLSMYESLLAFKQQSYLPFLQEISEQMIEELRKGESMAHQVSLSPFLKNILQPSSSMVKRAGCLQEKCTRTVNFY